MVNQKKDQNIGEKIFRSTIIIVAISILAKFVAFISETVNASYLGTTYQSDAYYMLLSIQQVLYPMLSVGIWKVFLPIYKDKLTQNDIHGANQLANKIITFFTVISIVAVALLIIFSNGVVSIVAPGFEGETKALCIQLVRISAPMYVCIITSAVYASMLQCHDNFLGSQIREVATHIPTIIATVLLYRHFGITVLAYALILGGVLRLLVELPFVDWGYKFKPDFRYKSEEFGIVLKRLPSALVSEGINQINTLVDKAMASTFPAGSVSGLNYGNRLTNVFSGLLSSAIATALYPQVIELISLKQKKELSNLITKIINIFYLCMVPISIACVMFSNQLVSAVFERGQFNSDSVKLTAGVFACYSIGLLFIACSTVITNIFYGHGDTKTPMKIGIANLFINVMLNLILSYFFGVNGLAMATSLAAIISFGIRLYFVNQYVDFIWQKLGIITLKTVVAGFIACAVARYFTGLLYVNVYMELCIAASIGVFIYLIGIKLLKVKELEDVISIVSKKMRRKGK